MGGKRKHGPLEAEDEMVDTSKPTSVFKPERGRKWTLSVALPGSIVANAQSRELQALLAGQIARALAVFCVDEVVIFDDGQVQNNKDASTEGQIGDAGVASKQDTSYTGYTDPKHFLAHILSYLECPPYLRKSLFSMHPNLQHSGMLPSLDMPHHLKKTEWCEYREGITRGKESGHPGRRNGVPKHDALRTPNIVDTGLSQNIYVDATIPAKTRVTVKFNDPKNPLKEHSGNLEASPVAPCVPREERGYYWGYSIRPASSLSAVFTECAFDGGYDLTFGTSERGMPISNLEKPGPDRQGVPTFNHLLIVFGGLAGLEVAVKADEELRKLDVKTPERLFDYWVNLVPGQGSKTIRTEEAVWLGLMALRDIALRNGRD
ncbi:MAG: hypothetical protein Q9163_003719 [Psora crenata]